MRLWKKYVWILLQGTACTFFSSTLPDFNTKCQNERGLQKQPFADSRDNRPLTYLIFKWQFSLFIKLIQASSVETWWSHWGIKLENKHSL